MQFLPGCGRPCGLAGRPGVPGEAGRCHSFSSSTSCGSEGVFGAFCAFFALLRVVPELSASRSWGALDDEEFFVIEGSGGGVDAGSFSQVSGHQLPNNAQCVWTDTSI